MAQFVYIDETGSVGTGCARQPFLTLVAVVVNEDKVQPLSQGLRQVTIDHLGWEPADFEFHGIEVWNGQKHWTKLDHAERISAYEAALGLLGVYDLSVAHATIDKVKLHDRHGGAADENAYRLALQFLLEKVDANMGSSLKVLVADEAKEQQLHAIEIVADMQHWGVGEVPGRQLTRVIDSLHFVRSNASPGVQLADMTAYVLQRHRRGREGHPEAEAAMRRLIQIVSSHTQTYRQPWPC